MARALAANGINAVVDLRAERIGVDAAWAGDVKVCVVPLVDHGAPTQEELAAAAAALVTLLGAGREVLVHCHAGIERAPTVACAALVLLGWTLGDAFVAVTAARPASRPTDGQVEALREFAVARRAR
jgi:protein-tyrosine phosphatase